MRRIALTLACLAVLVTPQVQADELPVNAGPLRSPESAAWHAPSASWFISNMGGVTFDLGPDAGKGFLTRIGQDGTVTDRWLEGLNRPRGVTASATHLFVAERDAVAIVEIATASVWKRVSVPGANGDLNDIVFDPSSGWVFVSAPSVGAIFAIRQPMSVTAHSEVFVQGPELTQPNGLALEPGYLVAAGLGLNSPAGPGGKVVRIDRQTKAVTNVTQSGLGFLDGIVKDGDDYLVTEYITGNVYRVARDGTVLLAHKLAPGAADLGIDPVRRVIMVPETLLNAVVVLPVL